MDINKIKNDATMTVRISGRVDTATSPILENELRNSFDGCRDMVLDFADVGYISSAGLRVLLSSHKVMSKKGGMKLKNVSPEVMEIFDVTGFSEILDII